MCNSDRSAKMNRALTKRVTELHSRGYDRDFSLTASHQLFCVQDNHFFIAGSASIKLVDQIYDKLFNQYKYVHVVESDSGERGILLINFIHFDAISELGKKLPVN